MAKKIRQGRLLDSKHGVGNWHRDKSLPFSKISLVVDGQTDYHVKLDGGINRVFDQLPTTASTFPYISFG